MRRAALSLALAALYAIPALADGEPAGRRHTGLKLPPPQSSVVVSIERGVRVWRPVTAAYAAINVPDAYAPDYPSYGAASPSAPDYGTGGYGFDYGWGLPYGYGYGYGYGHRHERLNGLNPLISRHPALARFHPDLPRALPDRIRIIGGGHPRGFFHPPVTIHVNLGPGAYGSPRGIRGHGGGPGRQAWGAPLGGGHMGAHGGSHRGGHR